MNQDLRLKLFIKKEASVIRHKIKKGYRNNLKKVMHIQKNHQKKQFRLCTKYKDLKEYNLKEKCKTNNLKFQILEINFVVLYQ